jgi:hypothetical protein
VVLMNGSIERLRRFKRLLHFAATHPVVPAMAVLVIGVRPSDPNHKATGYGGMIPLPAAAPAPAHRIDPLLEPRRDARAERGRVLYADGRVDRLTESTAHVSRKVCAKERLVQSRTNPAPNS